jgi:hypothetical protein
LSHFTFMRSLLLLQHRPPLHAVHVLWDCDFNSDSFFFSNFHFDVVSYVVSHRYIVSNWHIDVQCDINTDGV